MKLKVGTFDRHGTPTGEQEVELTQEQVEDIVSHAMQLSVIAGRPGITPDKLIGVVDELCEAVSVVI